MTGPSASGFEVFEAPRSGAVGMTRQGADYRLRKLREEGRVRSKKAGRELIWMLAED